MSDKETSPQKLVTYPARKLARERPTCPYCGRPFKESDQTPDNCYNCQASLPIVSELFNDLPRLPLELFVDPQNILTDRAKELIREPLLKLQKKIPQLNITFCTFEHTRRQDPKAIGFWLLNEAPFARGETKNDRLWKLLILVDQRHQRISLTTGYCLEPYLPDSELAGAAELMRPLYFDGQITKAMQLITKALKNSLITSHRKTKQFIKKKKS